MQAPPSRGFRSGIAVPAPDVWCASLAAGAHATSPARHFFIVAPEIRLHYLPGAVQASAMDEDELLLAIIEHMTRTYLKIA